MKPLFLYVLILLTEIHSHSRLKFPPARSDDSNLKIGRCGEKPKGSTVTTLSPGWVTIEFEETISHTGAPFRLALSSDGVEDGFDECILLNHIPHNDQSNPVQIYKINVEIPDVNCESCIIQLYNPMTDKIGAGNTCKYDHAQLAECGYGSNCPSELCTSNYHSCADVKITGTQDRNTFQCNQPMNWPYQEGAGLPCINTPCPTATKFDYTQISISWTNGWIDDSAVPIIFRDECFATACVVNEKLCANDTECMSFQTEVCNKGVETTSNCDYCPTISDRANITNYFSTTIYPTGCEGKVASHVPTVVYNPNERKVTCTVPHEGMESHWITQIYIKEIRDTDLEGNEIQHQMSFTVPSESVNLEKYEAHFIVDENVTSVICYEHCNQHGVWQSEVVILTEAAKEFNDGLVNTANSGESGAFVAIILIIIILICGYICGQYDRKQKHDAEKDIKGLEANNIR